MPNVALVGNPNTGKTTLFNALSGLRQRIGNYPGVTVEKKTGRMIAEGTPVDLVDLPGTYSLAPRSPDEMVAVDVLLGRQAGEPKPDAVINIVDASNLERNLYLTTQLFDMGVPVVVALNMMDVAANHGMTIDPVKLSAGLGVPVIPLRANAGEGVDDLKHAVLQIIVGAKGPANRPEFPPAFDAEVASLAKDLAAAGAEPVPEFLVRRLLLDVGGHTGKALADRMGSELDRKVADARARLAAAGCAVPAVEAKVRYGWIRKVVSGAVVRPQTRPVTATDRIDRVLTHRFWGTLVFLAMMFLVFQSLFAWASPVMDLIGDGQDALNDWLESKLDPGPLRSLLTDGVVAGVGGVVVFLPQILILFGFIAVLEDCGYMARAAFLMDKLMSRCGLSGKSFIPLLSSVACAVPGIMATRVIENPRDRIATILVAPLMSCSARLPVYVLLIGAFMTAGQPWWVPGFTLFCMYLIGFVVAPLAALVFKRTLLRGEAPVFVMEMPVYKRPSIATVLHRMYDAGKAFLVRAGTVILASMIVIWALLYFPRGEFEGTTYPDALEAMKGDHDDLKDAKADAAKVEALDDRINKVEAEWKAQTWLGRMGKAVEPAVEPLGWDWRLGMAAIASFPAREVVVGTLGIIYGVGEADAGEVTDAEDVSGTSLGKELIAAEWDGSPGRKVFTVPTALSLMIFFALCCQCASTLAVIRRETNSWRWPVFTFVYMTALAYVGALAAYQIGTALGG